MQNRVGSRDGSISMHTSFGKRSVRSGLRAFVFVSAASIAWISAASAQQAYPTQANQYRGFYDQTQPVTGALSRQDRADYDRSGTRGRMGLGASPYHPEGPGNSPD